MLCWVKDIFYEIVKIGKTAMDSFLLLKWQLKGYFVMSFEGLLCSLFDVVRIFSSKTNLLKKIIYDHKYHRKNVTFILVIPVFNGKDR